MKKKNKTALYVGLGLIAIAITILIIYFVRNSKKVCPDGSKVKKGQDCPKDESEVKRQETSNPPSSPPPVNNSFPLNVGDRGSNVTNLQNALIKMGKSIPAGATGYLGSQTVSALQSAGYDAPVSADDYNNILAGKTKSVSGSTSPATSNTGNKNVGRFVYATRDGVQLLDPHNGYKLLKTVKKGEFVGRINAIPDKNWYFVDSSMGKGDGAVYQTQVIIK